jgi:hypothetical protein
MRLFSRSRRGHRFLTFAMICSIWQPYGVEWRWSASEKSGGTKSFRLRGAVGDIENRIGHGLQKVHIGYGP